MSIFERYLSLWVALAMIAGIALGSAESAVSAAYSTTFEQTDQGRRFDAEGFHGLIESGMVRELWAGRPCLAP